MSNSLSTLDPALATASLAPVVTDVIAPPTRFISFLHPVNAASVRALITTVTNALREHNPPSLGLLMSTGGGDVNEGMLLFEFLRCIPTRLVTYNIGNVDSVGNAVFLAGKHRIAAAQATFLFHGVSWGGGQPINLDARMAREVLHVIEVSTQRIADVVTGHTTIPKEDVDKLFLQAGTKNAVEAKAAGIIHEIADPVLPDGNALVHSPAA